MATVRCDKCSFMNEPGARFCNQCGTALKQPCPKCGVSNAPGSKFCKECGQELISSLQVGWQASATSGAQVPGKKICPACHTVNEGPSLYCYNCGVTLVSQTVAGMAAMGNPAGFWVRAAAFIIDNILATVFAVLVLILLAGADASEVWAEAAGFKEGWRTTIFIELVAVAYYTFAIGRWGQTVGKALLGLKVTRRAGVSLTYWRSFARYWSYYLSFITLGVGFLMIALTSQKMALHDFVCDTRVIKLIR